VLEQKCPPEPQVWRIESLRHCFPDALVIVARRYDRRLDVPAQPAVAMCGRFLRKPPVIPANAVLKLIIFGAWSLGDRISGYPARNEGRV
jgi:hypothetical protein